MKRKLNIGVIGVGHLFKHMMPALVRSGHRFVLSQRGRETAGELARAYGLEIVSDNGDIVAGADVIILAVRPYDALAVCEGLGWREGQTVLSLCAGVPASQLAARIAPARLVMAMPVVAAEFGESPTLMFPADADCHQLLETCGPVVTLETEEQYASASVIACYYGWVHELIARMTDWTHEQGIDPANARLLVAQMTRAAATSVRDRTSTSISELVSELATPRSFTGIGLDVLRQTDAFAPWREAADAINAKYHSG